MASLTSAAPAIALIGKLGTFYHNVPAVGGKRLLINTGRNRREEDLRRWLSGEPIRIFAG